MRKILIVLMASGLLLPNFLQARDLTAEEAQLRVEGLAAMELNYGVDLKLEGQIEDAATARFVNYYFDYIQPRLNVEANLRMQQKILLTLVNQWVGISLEENQEWRIRLSSVEGELAAFRRDPIWIVQMDDWAALRQSLSGSLPDFATSLASFGDLDISIRNLRSLTENRVLDAVTLNFVQPGSTKNRTRVATGQVEGSCDENLTQP